MKAYYCCLRSTVPDQPERSALVPSHYYSDVLLEWVNLVFYANPDNL
jgi:hypothetical protein